MINHCLRFSARNILKHKSLSFINLFGLVIGMACAMLIFLWVEHQFSVDAWQPLKKRLYRLENASWVVMPPYLGETVKAFPEVEESVRFYFWYEPVLKYQEKMFTVTDFALVDSTVFNVFYFPFIAGSPETAFKHPYSIVLTESIAIRLFGQESAMGKASSSAIRMSMSSVVW